MNCCAANINPGSRSQLDMSQMGCISVSVPAKVIISGEYSVVMGKRGVACSINRRINVVLFYVEGSKTMNAAVEQRGKHGSRALNDGDRELELIKLIGSEIWGVDAPKHFEGMRLKVEADFPLSSGLGLSGALSVALAAIFFVKKKGPSCLVDRKRFLSEVNDLAYIGECISHGTPSGIDNTTSCYGGAISFESKALRKMLIPKTSFRILVVTTGPKSTSKSLEGFSVFAATNPKLHGELMDKLDKLSKTIESLLFTEIEGDVSTTPVLSNLPTVSVTELKELSLMFDEVEGILESLGLVSIEVKEAIKLLKSVGITAKMTGGGGEHGGSAVAIVPFSDGESEIMEKIRGMFEPRGWECNLCAIGEGLEVTETSGAI